MLLMQDIIKVTGLSQSCCKVCMLKYFYLPRKDILTNAKDKIGRLMDKG